MIKKINNIGIISLVVSTQLYSYSVPNEITRFSTGDSVQITKCDSFDWCKLTNGSGYIKKQHFKRVKKNLLVKKDSGISFLYAKKPIYKDDIVIYDYILENYQYNNLSNFRYGYVRVEDIHKYETKQNKANQKEITKKTFIKEKHIVEKKIPKTTDKKPKKTQNSLKNTRAISSKKLDQKKYFVYGGFGLSSINIKHNTNIALVSQAKDDKASLVEIGAGRYMQNNIFTTLSYSQEKLEIVDLSQFLLGVNYDFYTSSNKKLKTFIGANAGVSNMKWSKIPVLASSNNDMESSEFAYGANLGLNYKLDENWYLYTKYQYLKANHTTHIGNSTLLHNSLSNILFGMKYDIK
jgi:opacity protein-like surface antigen